MAQGIVPRSTEDLDFFTSRGAGSVEAASDALISAITAHGWAHAWVRTGDEFRRWAITGPETVLIDLAVDSPAISAPTVTIAGPSFAPAELAVRKTLALFGRAEPRDFIDVYVLHQRLERTETLRQASEADLGVDVAMFAARLRTHRRSKDDDFPDVGVSAAVIRADIEAWANELDPRMKVSPLFVEAHFTLSRGARKIRRA